MVQNFLLAYGYSKFFPIYMEMSKFPPKITHQIFGYIYSFPTTTRRIGLENHGILFALENFAMPICHELLYFQDFLFFGNVCFLPQPCTDAKLTNGVIMPVEALRKGIGRHALVEPRIVVIFLGVMSYIFSRFPHFSS